jgi:outer membrane protein, heavy metal efflux system
LRNLENEASRDVPTNPALRELAMETQPEIVAAKLRTQATAWGVRAAALQRVPDVTVSYERMFMEPLETGMFPMPGRRKDPWLVGASINLPIWHSKYAGIETEATRRHFAAHASVEEAVWEFDARLLDLWEQARAARATIELFEETLDVARGGYVVRTNPQSRPGRFVLK